MNRKWILIIALVVAAALGVLLGVYLRNNVNSDELGLDLSVLDVEVPEGTEIDRSWAKNAHIRVSGKTAEGDRERYVTVSNKGNQPVSLLVTVGLHLTAASKEADAAVTSSAFLPPGKSVSLVIMPSPKHAGWALNIAGQPYPVWK